MFERRSGEEELGWRDEGMKRFHVGNIKLWQVAASDLLLEGGCKQRAKQAVSLEGWRGAGAASVILTGATVRCCRLLFKLTLKQKCYWSDGETGDRL